MDSREQETCVEKTPRAEQIARLNDQLRKECIGGKIMVTSGVRALDGYDVPSLFTALRNYDAFDVDNDPHGERDLGDIDFLGAELLWKIDYYDTELTWGSPDPADPAVTIRVLTVMLAREY